jgi:hypothetical protein
MATSGSKGSKLNISQMVTCVGQQSVGTVQNSLQRRFVPHQNDHMAGTLRRFLRRGAKHGAGLNQRGCVFRGAVVAAYAVSFAQQGQAYARTHDAGSDDGDIHMLLLVCTT